MAQNDKLPHFTYPDDPKIRVLVPAFGYVCVRERETCVYVCVCVYASHLTRDVMGCLPHSEAYAWEVYKNPDKEDTKDFGAYYYKYGSLHSSAALSLSFSLSGCSLCVLTLHTCLLVSLWCHSFKYDMLDDKKKNILTNTNTRLGHPKAQTVRLCVRALLALHALTTDDLHDQPIPQVPAAVIVPAPAPGPAPAPPPAHPLPPVVPVATPVSSGGAWNCGVCTFLNENAASMACAMCGSPKP